jgi:hypothetical protein
MPKEIDPLDYEPVQEGLPTPFPFSLVLKILISAIAVPIAIGLFSLLLRTCYWFKDGKWPG